MRSAKAPAGRVEVEIDEAAAKRLHRIFAREAERIGKRRGLPPDLREDVVQDAWVEILENPALLPRSADDPPIEAPRRIAFGHRVKRVVRCVMKHRKVPTAVAVHSCHRDPDPGEPVRDEASLRRAGLLRAVDDLPVSAAQRASMRRYLGSCSAQRHAEKTGVAPESVYRWLRRVAKGVRLAEGVKRSEGSTQTTACAATHKRVAGKCVVGKRPRPAWWSEVCAHAADGVPTREIARLVGKSVRTVRYALEQSRADSAAGAASIAKNGGRQ